MSSGRATVAVALLVGSAVSAPAGCDEQVLLGGTPRPPIAVCAGAPCGALCSPCPPMDPTCPPPAQKMECDPMGACVPAIGLACPPPWVPCAQKVCGDPCALCDPADPLCQPMPGLACDPMGTCIPDGFGCPGVMDAGLEGG